MASPFDAYRLATNRVFDRVAGEDFVLLPHVAPIAAGAPDGNGRKLPRTDAPVQTPFRAIFFDKGAQLHAHGRSMADSTTRPIGAESPFLDYAVGDLPGQSRIGDLVLRVKTGVTYRVALDTEADIGRRHIRLNERSSNGGAP
jgi:hypothetical protein